MFAIFLAAAITRRPWTLRMGAAFKKPSYNEEEMRFRGIRAMFSLLVVGGLATAPLTASADEDYLCQSDAECAEDEICMLYNEPCDPEEPEECSDEEIGFCMFDYGDDLPFQPCESSSDCSEGQECTFYTEPCDPEDPEGCDEDPVGLCMDSDDDWSDDLPMQPCDSNSDCDAGWYCYQDWDMSFCAPDWMHSCNSDSDCGSYLVCINPMDDDGDFEDGDAGPADPPQPQFRPKAAGDICAPQYLSDCEVDADCGPGFTCEPDEWDCTVGSDGTTDCDDAVHSCIIVQVSCSSDSDCEAGWSCGHIQSEGSEFCLPPYYDDLQELYGDFDGSGGDDFPGGDPETGDNDQPTSGSDDDSDGDSDGDDDGDDDGQGAAPGEADGAGDDAGGDADGGAGASGGKSGKSGCAAAPASGPATLLSSLLVLGALIRRRRRA